MKKLHKTLKNNLTFLLVDIELTCYQVLKQNSSIFQSTHINPVHCERVYFKEQNLQ